MFENIRKEFPILEECTYLISNSLGAVPRKAKSSLERFYSLWSKSGVSAWHDEWWDLSRNVGDRVGEILGAGQDEVTMMTHATQAHWVALSTQFSQKDKTRNTIIMTDQDFPSSIYAVTQVAKSMGWSIDMVSSKGQPGLDMEAIVQRINDKTLFVATSHVYFKSAYIQDIAFVSAKARQAGALTLIDGYHAPGCVPVDVKALGVDFYVGGCLKWLCGGPGNAFLYVNPERQDQFQPALTGWLAHVSPFSFDLNMNFSRGAYKFMSGTPPIPCLYTALAGLEIIISLGITKIRKKSLHQTELIIKKAKASGFDVYTPLDQDHRGGAVSISVPHTFQVKQALEKRNIKVDFRKGQTHEPDVIRVGPHFYTLDAEIEFLFEAIDVILNSGEYKYYSEEINHVT